jgi:hypothetical protein
MGARRASLWLAAVVFAVAVFLLYDGPTPGQTQTPDVIEMSGDIEASRCAPCHLRIAEAQVPGLIFTHGNHLMVGCPACHYSEPHKDGVTSRPPMESCFNCHGILHGPEGSLATRLCEDCHTPSFDLRPNSHVEDWAARPHAERASTDTNTCMMCHDAPVDCDECHEEQGLDIGPIPPQYQAILREKPDAPSVEIYPDQPVTMGQCIYCHPDVDDFMPGAVIFEHAEHLRRNYSCDSCHTEFAHSNEQINRPDMQGCYRCHGLTHAAGGVVATEACEACHPPEFDLRPEDHTEEFVAGEHKDRALTDGAYCAMCHQEDFCIECHQGRRRGDDGKFLPQVIPADHKVVEWLGQHGGLYLAQEGMCGSCHDSDSCKRCHQTPMPHPANWLEDHSLGEGETQADCNVCHTNRSRCQSCHHDRVKRGELVAENCVPCHDEMRYEPATEIRHKGFSTHAVHFNVAESKGEPYKCFDCHVSIGSSAYAREVEVLQGHDLRLCYDCHGNLDIHNVQIAPWPGADLCRRCHTGLNL